MPYPPWVISPAIHQNEVTSVRNEIRRPAASAWRNVHSLAMNVACTIHKMGAIITSASDVALTPPTVTVSRANSAGDRHPPVRMLRDARPMSHGRPANGRRMTEMRAS